MAWLLDSIPLWVWLGAGALTLAATANLWLPLWSVLPNSLRVALVGLVAIAGAFLAGRKQGADNEKQRTAERTQKSIEISNQVERDVNGRSDADLDKSFDRWMRHDK